MRLIDFQFEHLELFDWREEEYKMYNVGSEFVKALLAVETRGECYTAMHNGQILVIGGILRHSEKTGYAFTMFSKHAENNVVASARLVKRMFSRMIEDMGLHRVVTYNLEKAERHHKWCEWLGFVREDRDGIKNYDDEGNTYFQYGLVR